MEKNCSYVSPELDLVEVDSYVCCMGDSTKDDQDKDPGYNEGEWD